MDNMMFSVYLSTKVGNSTHIKFGGFDEEGIEGGIDNLGFLTTNTKDSWLLQMKSIKIGEDEAVDIDR